MTPDAAIADDVAEPPVLLPSSQRWRIMFFGGCLLLLINFGAPAGGLINVPVTFFLKNRLHLKSNETAIFLLWAGVPLFLSFVFGMIRDRWSPFGTGDRGHLVLFGLTTAAIYSAMAFIHPTYLLLVIGLVLVTASFQMVLSAGNGLATAIGHQHAMAGQMGALLNIATSFPALAAYFVGGLLSQMLEGQNAVTAAKILFLCAAALMVAIAGFGVLGPSQLFEAAEKRVTTTTLSTDIGRLLKHWPIYPVLLIQLLWQFGPAAGTVLQYHLSNTLHATDAQWGQFNAIFLAAFIPVFAVYGWVCQRVKLSTLLWAGSVLAVFQMVPLLFVHSAVGALWAGATMGVIGGIAQGAFVDLAIRSSPPGLQGTMMMLFVAAYYVAVRFGDLFGTWLYDHHGGFKTAVFATIIVYALIVPVILIVPKRLISTTDGQAAAA
jgi:MFS family permease